MNDRKILQLAPQVKPDDPGAEADFSSLSEVPNIVLLGDPGAGKTHLFRSAAQATGGHYMTVRSFLNARSDWSADTVFIDALDERRAGRGDDEVVDAIVQRLFACAPARVRISCRAQDWLAESDLEAFRQYFDDHGGVIVVSLFSLSAQEQRTVLAEHGMDVSGIDGFLAEVDEHGLAEFKRNPQDLKMLATAVTNGVWPATRADLFEQSTRLWLAEHNSEHARRDQFPAEAIRQTAGALCALRLISDVEGFALDPASRDAGHPDATEIPFVDVQIINATLRRHVFTAIPGLGAVDYAHRTTAEFLAAEWLAARLNDGLSFRRLGALLGHDGRPVSQLRGLHAWLTVRAPRFAEQLVASDPYGALSYGDPASLSPSLRLCLLRALAALAVDDPWFLSGDGRPPSERLSGMTGAEMTGEFRSILRAPDNPVRPLVLAALAAGTPDVALTDDIAAVMIDSRAMPIERENALAALLKCGQEGEAAVLGAYTRDLSWGASDLQLRAEVIVLAYGRLFQAIDVVALLEAIERTDESLRRRLYLWHLADAVPLQDIPAILGMRTPAELDETDALQQNESAVSHALSLMLIRLLKSGHPVPPDSLWNWLDGLRDHRASPTAYSGLQKALSARMPDVLNAVADGLRALPADTNVYLLLQRLQRMTAGTVEHIDLLDTAVRVLRTGAPEDTGLPVVYELALWMLYTRTQERPGFFEYLFDYGEQKNLQARRDSMLVSEILDWRQDNARRSRERHQQADIERANLIAQFGRHEAAIRSGLASGWIGWVANVYLGKYHGIDHSLSPHGRLVACIGDTFADSAMVGLLAALERTDIPDVAAIGSASLEAVIPTWWLALVAGLDAHWGREVSLEGLPDPLLAAALAVDLASPTSNRDGNTSRRKTFEWKAALFSTKRELARDTYLEVARLGMAARYEHVEGLSELLSMDAFAWCRTSVTMEVLSAYPDLPVHFLERLMEVVLADATTHAGFTALAGTRLSEGALPPRAFPHWQVTAFLLQPALLEPEFTARASTDVGLVWTLRDYLSGHVTQPRRENRMLPLSVLTRLLVMAAGHFPNAAHPEGGSYGDRNPWDGAELVRRLINQIALDITADATAALARLSTEASLGTYRDHLLHAAAEQRARRRDAEYQQPNWAETVSALSNGAPVNTADFHALLVDTIQDVGDRIANANSNIYKRFWNENGYGKVTEPKPEESGRDVLIDLLRERLNPKGITVEPEGHMVHGKRADIVVIWRNLRIPVELKRNYHADVWTAPVSQLDRLYTRDPGSAGYGIYAVFWYGNLKHRPAPSHPTEDTRAESASAMLDQITGLVPQERRWQIAVAVIDVSGQSYAAEPSDVRP
jgi:hypothetical protein